MPVLGMGWYVDMCPMAGTLEQLWLSYNNIASFSGIERLKQLRVLCIANNKIKSWAELERLTQLPLLAEVRV